MENPDYYPGFVESICKPGEDILASLTPEDAHCIHMLMGICGEVGELVDAIKKASIYRKPLDMDNVKEELGDIEFYLQGIRNRYGLIRNDILAGNIGKLSKRYPAGFYSNAQAINRADKSIGGPSGDIIEVAVVQDDNGGGLEKGSGGLEGKAEPCVGAN